MTSTSIFCRHPEISNRKLFQEFIYNYRVIVNIVILYALTVLICSFISELRMAFPSTPFSLESVFGIGLLGPEYK